MKMATVYKSDQENYLKAAASTNVSRNLLPSFNDTDSDEDQPIPLPRRLRTMNQTGSSFGSLATPRRRPSSGSDSKSTVKTVILGRMNIEDSQVTRKEPVRKDETEKNKGPSPASTEVVTQNRESPVLEAMEQFDDVTDSGAPPLPEEVIVVSINTNDNHKTDSSSAKHLSRQIVLTRNGVKNPVASPITRKRKGAAADAKSKKVDAAGQVLELEEPVKEQLEEPCDNYTGGKKVVGTSRISGRKRKILHVAEEEVSTPIRQDRSKESGKDSNKITRSRRASQSNNASKKRRREKESSPTSEEEQSPSEVNKRVSLRKSQRIISSSQPTAGPSNVPSSLSLSQQPSTCANRRRSTRPSVAAWPKRTKTSAKIEKKKVSLMESVPSDEDEPFPRASQEPQSSSQSVAAGPSCSQGSLALSQQSTSSSRSRYDRRRSIFDIARLSQPSPAPSESFVKRTSVGRKKKEETGKKKKKKPVKSQEEEPERYVGKHCFGNYHMMPTEKVSELLNSMRPDHDLDPQQVRAFSRNVNYFLEDFFTFYCNQTSQYYGFLPFSELKQALTEQCLIDEDASDLDLIREMKQHFTKEEFEKAEGVLFPSRYSARRDTDDYLIK